MSLTILGSQRFLELTRATLPTPLTLATRVKLTAIYSLYHRLCAFFLGPVMAYLLVLLAMGFELTVYSRDHQREGQQRYRHDRHWSAVVQGML